MQKRKVIKTIVRRKKKTHGPSAADGNDAAYTGPSADFVDEGGDKPTTPKDAMDHYAQACAEADASHLSMAEKHATESVDSIPATQVDETEKQHVIDLEPELGDFMDQHVDDRQRFPEEESLQEEHGQGVAHVDTQETLAYDPSQVPAASDAPEQPDGGQKNTDDPAAPDAEVHVPEEDHQPAWKQDDWSCYEQWPHNSWDYGYGYYGGSWKGPWDHGYGYYGSWSNWNNWEWENDESTPSRRSHSVESRASGLSGLTSVSKLHATLNRLNTPDLEPVKKPDHKEPENAEEKKNETPVGSGQATSPSSSVKRTPGDEMNDESQNGSDVGTALSSSNGDTSVQSGKPDDAIEEKKEDQKAA